MKCTTCRLPSAYNRAVVDPATGDVVGCLCTQCIDDFFGRALEAYSGDGSTCVLCDGPGDIALPEWQCTSVEDDACVVVTGADASVSHGTPHLCEMHFRELRDLRDDADVAAASARRRARR